MKRLKIDTNVQVKRLLVFTKRLVNSNFLGNYRSVFKGKGIEFDSYREYTPDDDASLIDWKASARGNELMVKQFVEERNMTIYFMIDCSSSMILGSQEKLKSEYAAEFVTSMAHAVLASGDNVGFAMFTTKPVMHNPPSSGLKEYQKIVEALANPKFYGGRFNFREACNFMISALPANAVVIIVSDFIPAETTWKEELGLISQKFDVIGVMIRDPLDFSLPGGMGLVRVQDPFSGKILLLEPNSVSEEYKRITAYEALTVKRAFEERGCDFFQVVTNKPFIVPLLEFFEWRANKWR